jgi:hypothetical protein
MYASAFGFYVLEGYRRELFLVLLPPDRVI